MARELLGIGDLAVLGSALTRRRALVPGDGREQLACNPTGSHEDEIRPALEDLEQRPEG